MCGSSAFASQSRCKDVRCSLVHKQEVGWHGNAFAAPREVRVDDVLEGLLWDVPQLSRRVPPVWELHGTHSRPYVNSHIKICNVCMGQYGLRSWFLWTFGWLSLPNAPSSHGISRAGLYVSPPDQGL